MLARLRREQQSLAVMDHPDIARVFDAGRTTDGRPYFAMELVEGEPITRFCRGKRLSLDERLRLFERVCAAVQHAHGKGVIHRDLKPSNILVGVGAEGHQLKVIDFGIAKAIEEGEATGRTLQTMQGQIIGTPGYMSPEQALGSTDIDTRSDVYSLGALLYELLSDSAPFSEETFQNARAAEVLRLLREEDPPPPSRRLTESGSRVRLPRDLDWIAMKALSRERERRYGTAAALGDDVRRFRAHEPVTAGAPGLGYRLSKFLRKHRVAAALVAGLVLALMVGLVFALRAAEVERAIAARERVAADREREVAHDEREVADDQREIAERERAVRLEVQETLSLARRDAGIRAAQDGRSGLAALWFELAGGEMNAARAAFHREAAALPVAYIDAPHLGGISYLRFAESGEFLIEGGSSGGALIYDLEKQKMIGERWTAACFLSESLCARGTEEGAVEIFDLRTRKVIDEFKVPSGKLLTLAQGDDGEVVLVETTDSLSVWNRIEQRFVARRIEHEAAVIYAKYAYGGGKALSIDANYKLRIFDLNQTFPKVSFPPLAVDHTGYLFDTLAPDFYGPHNEKILANVGGRACYFSSENGSLLREVSDSGETVYELGSGGRLASSHYRGRYSGMSHFLPGTNWRYLSSQGQVVDASGRARLTIPFANALPYRFSRDGTLYACRRDYGIMVVRIPGRAGWMKEVVTPLAGRPVYSPDSRFFASAGGPPYGQAETRTRVYDAVTGEPAGPILDRGSFLYDAAFSRDGQKLWTVGEGGVQTWDWKAGTRLGTLPTPSQPRAVLEHPTEGWAVVACAGGELLRVDEQAKSAKVFYRWEVVGLEKGRGATGQHLAFSADGKRVYVSGIDAHSFGIDLATGDALFPAVAHEAATRKVLLSEEVFMVPGSSRVRDWCYDPISGKRNGSNTPISFYRPSGVVMSASGESVLISSDREVGLVDWRTGQRLSPSFAPEASGTGMCSAFVGDSHWVLTVERTAAEERRLHLWELATGMSVAPPVVIADDGVVQWISVSPDRKRAVAASRRGSFVLVDYAQLAEFVRPGSGLSKEDRLELAMIDSAHDLVEGRPVRMARGDAWAARWRAFMGKRPRLRSLRRNSGLNMEKIDQDGAVKR